MAEILKKHKKAVILLGMILLLAVLFLTYSYYHQQRLRNQADFIVTLDGKEILIPGEAGNLPTSHTVIELNHYGSAQNLESSRYPWIVLVYGTPENGNSYDPTHYPVRFYCQTTRLFLPIAIVRYNIRGVYISREYSENASINGVFLNDNKEEMIKKWEAQI